jgi:hypothetical protein
MKRLQLHRFVMQKVKKKPEKTKNWKKPEKTKNWKKPDY